MAQRIAVVTSDLDHLVEVLQAYASGGDPAGLRQGRADATDDLADALVSGSAGRAYLAALVDQGEWRQLATLWTRGVDVDWAAADSGGGRRISLPSYPFEPQRHWFTESAAPPTEPEPVLPQLFAPVWVPAEEPDVADGAPAGPVWIMHDAESSRLAEALAVGRDARLIRADAARLPTTSPIRPASTCCPPRPGRSQRIGWTAPSATGCWPCTGWSGRWTSAATAGGHCGSAWSPPGSARSTTPSPRRSPPACTRWRAPWHGSTRPGGSASRTWPPGT
ncbi:hypothetical protein [Micromonospora tarensis]|uniref:hypothetical protein n=1 Tax=Micromonospora tarensis TaxID=2806100 RepID=UPI0038993CE7